MSLRTCVLGSGSKGNCIFIASATTSILIDAGLSAKETKRRLVALGEDIEQVRAVCISHEHQDHTVGLPVLHRYYGVDVFANSGTVEGLSKIRTIPWNIFETGSTFEVGDLSVQSFAVPHDAYEPVGFVVSHATTRIGIVMDAGMATNVIRERLRLCNAVIVESNYDERLLQEAQRPWFLKQRIKGRQGHLSNEHAAAMLAEIAGPQLDQVFLAHLSEDCNRQELALEEARLRLRHSGQSHVRVSLSYPDRISEVWTSRVPASPACEEEPVRL